MPFEVMEAGKVGLLFSHKILKADGWGEIKTATASHQCILVLNREVLAPQQIWGFSRTQSEAAGIGMQAFVSRFTKHPADAGS